MKLGHLKKVFHLIDFDIILFFTYFRCLLLRCSKLATQLKNLLLSAVYSLFSEFVILIRIYIFLKIQ
jgi:Ni/Fe-hydrogenase subunit HybB-like protein